MYPQLVRGADERVQVEALLTELLDLVDECLVDVQQIENEEGLGAHAVGGVEVGWEIPGLRTSA